MAWTGRRRQRYPIGMSDTHDIEIDAIGLRCPLPVLRLQQALRARPAGAVVTLLASDSMAAVDVPHFCNEAGHELIDMATRADDGALEVTAYKVRRGP